MALISAVALGVSGAAGCTGVIDGERGGAPTQGSGAPGTNNPNGGSGGGGVTAPLGGPGRVVMRRLNPAEYNNTVRDLLGTNQRLSENFPPDYTAHGFDNVASALNMTDATFGYFFEAAKRVVAELLSSARRDSFVTCDLEAEGEACVAAILESFLPRAWRRPLEPGDVEPLVGLYTTNKADGATDDEALGRVLQAVLMAPEFLYRVERNSGMAGVRNLNGYEIASRLSYFLWSSMPDAELLAAAERGELADAAGIAAQVRRMLESGRAAAFAESFGSQWLPLRTLDNVHPDADAYPAFDEELRAAMREETMRFFVDVANGSRSLRDLLTSRSGYVNDRLASHYDMAPVGSLEPVFTALPENRIGLLTQGSVLTVLSYPKESNPVRRGKWILSQLLCREPPPPLDNVLQEPPPQAGLSRRERLEAHKTEAICRGCHELMDPLGLALEQFDGIGAFRTTDAGLPIDTSGVFDGQAFATPAELAELIANDPALPGCVTQHVLTYGLGRAPREESDFDQFVVGEIGKAFADSGYLFPRLVEAIVTSDLFRKREDEAASL